MVHIVGSIYFSLGVLVVVLTYFDQYSGPVWFESLGNFFIFVGLVLHVIGFIRKTIDKSKQK